MKIILHYLLLVSGTLYFLSNFWVTLQWFQIGTIGYSLSISFLMLALVPSMLCLLAANHIKPVFFMGGKMNRNLFIVLGVLLTILFCLDVYSTWVQNERGFLIMSLPPPKMVGMTMTTQSMSGYLSSVFRISLLPLACFFAAHTIKPFGDKS